MYWLPVAHIVNHWLKLLCHTTCLSSPLALCMVIRTTTISIFAPIPSTHPSTHTQHGFSTKASNADPSFRLYPFGIDSDGLDSHPPSRPLPLLPALGPFVPNACASFFPACLSLPRQAAFYPEGVLAALAFSRPLDDHVRLPSVGQIFLDPSPAVSLAMAPTD